MSLPPRRVADRYVLQSLLGRGGAGAVWLALDEVLQRDVAVKEVPFPPGLPDAEREVLRARALREGRAAARLAVRGAVTVFDAFTEADAAYLVMELVHAPTLGVLVEDHGPLDPVRAARLGSQLLGTLQAAHAAGVVHRDVKPGNVLVRQGDQTALTDFGIATLAGDPALTATGFLVGSPQFMAPEQAHGLPSTAQTDLWGLGATLYYAVEGVGPFDRADALATLNAIAHDQPRPPQRAGGLAPVLMGLLRKDPQDRLSAGETAAALEEVARGDQPRLEAMAGSVTRVTEVASPAPSSPAPTAGRDPWAAAGTAGRPRRGMAVLAAGGALVLVAGAGVWAVARPEAQAPPAQETPSDEPSSALPSPSPPPSPEPPASTPDAEASPRPSATREPDPTPSPSPSPSPSRSPVPSPSPSRPRTPAPGPAVPDDWVTYVDADREYTVAYPPDWDVVQVSDTLTDFRDPASSRYLRVDWTDQPPPSAVGAWEASSAAFAQNHENYVELGISETEFRGYEAALWEYTYSRSGTTLRASNLGIATGPYGYALNFQTRESDWEASREVYEFLEAGFEFGPGSPDPEQTG